MAYCFVADNKPMSERTAIACAKCAKKPKFASFRSHINANPALKPLPKNQQRNAVAVKEAVDTFLKDHPVAADLKI